MKVLEKVCRKWNGKEKVYFEQTGKKIALWTTVICPYVGFKSNL